ncbi:hypothetical protein N431DRAFT_413162 [Stipitochalara longipes BDJ]|nr:hypothetical protein N431DRAFT_413162 [Stipitochalara longipes BDJ]
MLPSFLESTYKKYKNDTSVLLKWLCYNGSKCGYQLSEPSKSKDKTTKAPRLKGKARKQAKEASSDGSTTSKTDQSEHRTVSSKDLVPLANSIACSTDPLITVPSYIMRAALRAISARKRCNVYFRSKTDGDDSAEEKNQSHSYFISLIEEVVMALQPRFATSAGAKNEELVSTPTIIDLEDLENRFAALEVEELAGSDSEIAEVQAVPSPTSEVICKVEPSREREYLEQEKLFAIFCLFDDLDRLRSYISNLWVEFKEEKIDIITASVTTNTAIQLAIRTQNEILIAFPECSDYQKILETLVLYFAKAQGLNETEGEVEVDDDVAQWIFAPAHSILDSFCDVLDPKRVPIMKRGHFGVYDPQKDRSALSDVEKNTEDFVLLMDILPEFCFIAKHKIHLFAKDELTKGLCRMVLTKDIPVWLTFATTVFLDIHHTLRDEVIVIPRTLLGTAVIATENINRYLELSGGLIKPATWPKKNEDALRAFVKEMDYCISNDPIFPLKEAHLRREKCPPPEPSEWFWLYKRHPVLCGVMQFTIMLATQQWGLMMVNAMGTAIFPAHFYNSMRQLEEPVRSWHLMDELISLHGEDKVFIGAKPTTIVDCWKQFCLTLGVSAENFARNRRNTKLVASKKGPRGLKEISLLNELFYQGLREEGEMNLTLHGIEALLNDQVQNHATHESRKRLRRVLATKEHLTSLQLLEALRLALPQEIDKLQFRYFYLHEQSIALMRRLRATLDEDFKHHLGKNYIENESQLPHVGLWVIQAAVKDGNVQDAEDIRISHAGKRILDKARQVTDEFLEDMEEVRRKDPRPLDERFAPTALFRRQ